MKKVSLMLTLLVALLVPSTAFAANSVKLNANCYNWQLQDFQKRTSASDSYDWEWSGNYNNSSEGFTIVVDGNHKKGGAINFDQPAQLNSNDNTKVNGATDWTTRYFYYDSNKNELLVKNEPLQVQAPAEKVTYVLKGSFDKWGSGYDMVYDEGTGKYNYTLADTPAGLEIKIVKRVEGKADEYLSLTPNESVDWSMIEGGNTKVTKAFKYLKVYYSVANGLELVGESENTPVTPVDPTEGSTFYLNTSVYGYGANSYNFTRINGYDGFDYELHVTGYNNGSEGFQIYDSATNQYWKAWKNADGSNNVNVNGEAYGMKTDINEASPAWLMNNGGNAQGDFYFYWNAIDNKVLVTTERRAEVFKGIMLFGDFENTNGKQWPTDESSLRSFAPNKNVKWEVEEQVGNVKRYYATFDFFSPKSNFRINYNGTSYGPSEGDKADDTTSQLMIEAGKVVDNVKAGEQGHSYAITEGYYNISVYVINDAVHHFEFNRNTSVNNGHTAFFDAKNEKDLYLRGAGCFAGSNGNWDQGRKLTRIEKDGKYIYYTSLDRIYATHDEYNNQFKVGTGEEKDWQWGFTSYNPAVDGSYTDLLYDRFIGCPQRNGEDTNMSMGSDSKEGCTVYVALYYDPVDPNESEIIVTYHDPSIEVVVDPFELGLWLHYDAVDNELGNGQTVKMERDEVLNHLFKCNVYMPIDNTHFTFATAESDINNSHRFGPGESQKADMPLKAGKDEWTSGEVNYNSALYNDNGATPDPETAGSWILKNDKNANKQLYTVEFDTANGKVRVYRAVPTGIEEIEAADANAAAEYFNLQGVRVANPVQGQIYIVRRGTNVTKQIMR